MLLTVCGLVASLVVGIIGTYAVSDTLRINAEEKMKLICDVNVKEINTLFETVMVSTDVLSTAFSQKRLFVLYKILLVGYIFSFFCTKHGLFRYFSSFV